MGVPDEFAFFYTCGFALRTGLITLDCASKEQYNCNFLPPSSRSQRILKKAL